MLTNCDCRFVQQKIQVLQSEAAIEAAKARVWKTRQ